MKKYLFMLFILGVSIVSYAQQLERNELLTAFIYNFAQNIQWEDESQISEFNFLIISEDKKAIKEFNKINEGRDLLGKAIKLTSASALSETAGLHLIFVARDQIREYENIFDAVEGKNILLISDNYSDQKLAMINFVDIEDKKLQFEINKANILNQGLKILPDMVLLGGTEIDVAELYRESQQSLRGMQIQVDELMINQKSLQNEILQGTLEMDKQKIIIDEQEETITQQKKLSDTQYIQIESQKTLSNKLRSEINSTNQVLEKQTEVLAGQKIELDKQKDEINSGKTVLSSQEKQIMSKEQQIIEQNQILNSQISTLNSQRNIIYLLGSIILLILGLIFTIYHSYQKNQKANKLISEQKLQLENALVKLKAANKELEAFSYSVSHDLRAPLRAINGFTRVLMEDYVEKLDDEGKRLGSIILSNSLKMGILIDDLLAFSRLGRAAMHFSDIDMKSLVNDIYMEITSPEEREKINFELAELPNAGGDLNMLRQVWINILSNAIKFSSKQKKPVISVTCQQENDTYKYCVRDNGVGFNMQYMDKLFGVFQRLHSEKEFAGTGVGLALVNRIVKRHNGSMGAEGEVDKGAAFCFSLPKKYEN